MTSSTDAAMLEEMKERAIDFAEGLAAASGLDVTVDVDEDGEEDDSLTIAFEGPDSKMLVGRGGQVLDALQYIASLVVNRRGGAAPAYPL